MAHAPFVHSQLSPACQIETLVIVIESGDSIKYLILYAKSKHNSQTTLSTGLVCRGCSRMEMSIKKKSLSLHI